MDHSTTGAVRGQSTAAGGAYDCLCCYNERVGCYVINFLARLGSNIGDELPQLVGTGVEGASIKG